jgi:carbon-monoxide dehydrogenase medium subunit
VEQGDPIVIGALVTHSELARLATGAGPLGAVAEAARRSAFPAVRNVATVGGNICADPFPEADLVPALLAAAADVELAGPQGDRTLPLSSYLAERATRPPGELVCRIRVPAPAGRRAWFERLTVRAGGEYAVASVALSVDLDGEERVLDARLAVGSVAATPLRSAAAERVLIGNPLDDSVAAEAGAAAAEEIEPREDPGAAGWYRLAVLPALVRRAAARIAAHEEAAAA